MKTHCHTPSYNFRLNENEYSYLFVTWEWEIRPNDLLWKPVIQPRFDFVIVIPGDQSLLKIHSNFLSYRTNACKSLPPGVEASWAGDLLVRGVCVVFISPFLPDPAQLIIHNHCHFPFYNSLNTPRKWYESGEDSATLPLQASDVERQIPDLHIS